MRIVLIAVTRRLLAGTLLALIALTLNGQPVHAQYSINYIPANYSKPFARYYAPYALQAAAAYMDVVGLDATRADPGADVKAAVAYVIDDSSVAENATKYLRPWRYQFGSQSYLTCFEQDPDCLKEIRKDRFTFAIPDGPAFHVWARMGSSGREGSPCSEVSIAFRGTDLSAGVFSRRGIADSISDVDPGTGYIYDTHYRQLRRNIDAIIKKITTLRCYRAGNSPRIVSVGHSLGGGLAQLAALANKGSRRIAKVFAFDPTSVTGADYVDEQLRNQNARTTEFDRIYESGEFLQPVRQKIQQFPKSTAPCVRSVVFGAFGPSNPLASHNMSGLAREMVRMSYWDDNLQAPGPQQDFHPPGKLPRCPDSQYIAPANDNDELAPDGTFMSSRNVPTRVASANRGRAMNSYAMASGYVFGSPQPTEMNGSVAPANAKKPDASTGRRAARAQAPVVHAAFDAGWPPG